METYSFNLRPSRIAKALAVLGSGALFLMSGQTLQAQQSSKNSESTVVTLDEIIVTAEKRSQTLQDTPIAVSVVSGDVLQEAEIQDPFDLQSLVPALEIRQSSGTISAGYVIRGFGGISSNAGIEPSVGVFVDGIYRSRSSAQISDFYSVERVEVLRGPQSTLFGKNASVGVVSIISKKPEFDRSGSAALTVGTENTVRGNIDLTGALSDKLAYRLGITAHQRDGYATNLSDGSEVNDRNRWGVQGQLLFEPNENTQLRVMADYDDIDESCCYTANLVSGPVTDFVVGALGQFVDEDPFSYEGFLNFSPINEVENAGASLHIDTSLGWADFTSITSFRDVESFQFSDGDATSTDIATSLNTGEVDTFTQEIRFTSNENSDRVRWMIGASYFDESISFPGEFLYGDDFRAFADAIAGGALTGAEFALGLPLGQTFGQSGQGVFETREQENTSFSVFGSLDFELSDALTATVGLSYIDDEKEASFRQTNTDVFSSLDFVALGFAQALASFGVNAADPRQVAAFASANPAGFAALQAAAQDPAQNPLLGLQALQFLPPFLDFPNVVEDGRSNDDKVTYNLRLAYDINDSVNVYASFATGFKATSWNLSRDSKPFATDFTAGSAVTNPPPSPIRDAGLAVNNLTVGTRFAGPEETEVIEIGLKAQFDRMSLNLAIFEQTVEGFQSNVFTGIGFALANAGEQSTTGLEIDGRWLLTDSLSLTFAGAFYDPKFDEFTNSPSGDLTGQRPAGVVRTATSLGLDYQFDLAGKVLNLRADWEHSGKTDFFNNTELQDLLGVQREYDLVNASLSMSLSEAMRLSIWGRNIFDEQYLTGAFPSIAQSGSISGFVSQPATYGVTLRYDF